MSTSSKSLESARVLVVGMGGLGCPAALALAEAGVSCLVLADDDVVDVTNLHRQILFDEADVGTDKLDAAERTLRRLYPRLDVDRVRSRLLPDNARDLVRQADVVIEGADNYATKFLASDACRLEETPVVHGSAVRWRATAWAVSPAGAPCYRCLFEDVPRAGADVNCAEAGVMGPVVGLAGALLADLGLRVLAGDPTVFGSIHTYDGRRDRLRAVEVPRRPDCPLCGTQEIFDIDEARYTGQSCAA